MHVGIRLQPDSEIRTGIILIGKQFGDHKTLLRILIKIEIRQRYIEGGRVIDYYVHKLKIRELRIGALNVYRQAEQPLTARDGGNINRVGIVDRIQCRRNAPRHQHSVHSPDCGGLGIQATGVVVCQMNAHVIARCEHRIRNGGIYGYTGDTKLKCAGCRLKLRLLSVCRLCPVTGFTVRLGMVIDSDGGGWVGAPR